MIRCAKWNCMDGASMKVREIRKPRRTYDVCAADYAKATNGEAITLAGENGCYGYAAGEVEAA